MTRRSTRLWIALILSTLIGCSSSETSETSQATTPCPRPSGFLSFGTGVDCFQQSYEHDVTGTFTATADGFHVDDTAGGSLSIAGLTAAIPDGTFVRARFWCVRPYAGGSGQLLLLENVATLEGTPNSTEDGARLWLVAVGGGEAFPHAGFPFKVVTETACTAPRASENETRDPEVQRVTFIGEGFSVTAEPEQNVPFEIETSPNAGSYQLHNVNTVDAYYGCCHVTVSRNFMVTRAD